MADEGVCTGPKAARTRKTSAGRRVAVLVVAATLRLTAVLSLSGFGVTIWSGFLPWGYSDHGTLVIETSGMGYPEPERQEVGTHYQPAIDGGGGQWSLLLMIPLAAGVFFAILGVISPDVSSLAGFICVAGLAAFFSLGVVVNQLFFLSDENINLDYGILVAVGGLAGAAVAALAAGLIGALLESITSGERHQRAQH